jgi:hypothetical protein
MQNVSNPALEVLKDQGFEIGNPRSRMDRRVEFAPEDSALVEPGREL